MRPIHTLLAMRVDDDGTLVLRARPCNPPLQLEPIEPGLVPREVECLMRDHDRVYGVARPLGLSDLQALQIRCINNHQGSLVEALGDDLMVLWHSDN